jgi:hypothetical protein
MHEAETYDQPHNVINLKESLFSFTVGAIVKLRDLKCHTLTKDLYDRILEATSNAGRAYKLAEESISENVYADNMKHVYEQLNETKFCLKLAKMMTISKQTDTAVNYLMIKAENIEKTLLRINSITLQTNTDE